MKIKAKIDEINKMNRIKRNEKTKIKKNKLR